MLLFILGVAISYMLLSYLWTIRMSTLIRNLRIPQISRKSPVTFFANKKDRQARRGSKQPPPSCAEVITTWQNIHQKD